jgi:succinyl-CoA synthetase alpha subunit
MGVVTMSILLNKNSKILVQGITGREARMVTKHTLDYGTSIVAGVTPGKAGDEVYGVPVFDTVKAACEKYEISATAIYVPPAAVYDSVMEALDNNIKLIFITTENIPQLDVIKFLYYAKEKNARIIGPNSVGIISPNDRIKLGAIGGDDVDRCFVPGNIGVISRSGGMTAETAWMVKKSGYGVSTAISIGGDAYIGTSPVELLELFEDDADTDAVVTFSEPGTRFEEDMADSVYSGAYSKTLISFIAGKFTEKLPQETVFGHAGAMISGDSGKPSQKITYLKKRGVFVAEKFDDIIDVLQETMNKC